MVFFVLVLGSILTAGLIAVDSATAPIIAAHESRALKSNVLQALGIAATAATVESAFAENVEVADASGRPVYRTRNGKTAFQFSGSGLWGPIRGIMALGPDRQTVEGLTIIRQEETPGLGGRIAEKEFLTRFNGKRIVPRLFVQSPGKAATDNDVDGIAGATLSCKAFERILNDETGKVLALLVGGTR